MLSIQQPGPDCRAKIEGEVSIFHAQALFDDLTPILNEDNNLTIDLTGVTQIDSSIIQVLMITRQHLSEKGRELILINHSQPVIDALETMGLAAWFSDPMLLSSRAKNREANL